jgi:hypothetical protein
MQQQCLAPTGLGRDGEPGRVDLARRHATRLLDDLQT